MDFHLCPLLLLSALAFSNPELTVKANGGIIGAIVDNNTRIGKEDTVAMEMAVDDICNQTNRCLALRVNDSHGEAAQATLAARHLMNENNLQVILGPTSWEEAASVAEVVNGQTTPILSFADSSPPWATRQWPFLFQASPSKQNQMKAVAAIVQSWGWRRVNVIYEDVDSATNGITPHLYDALQEVGAQISLLIAIPSFADASLLTEELHKLKRQQCRVFVVHVSLPLAGRLFKRAKEMKMMEQGYVWITTDSITKLVHCLNSSIISTMQGVLGVKSYNHNEDIKYEDFHKRFEDRFRLKYPQEKNHEPGSFALEAYDAAWAVALAMKNGKINLEKLSRTNYSGLSGEIHFDEGRLPPMKVFQVINVIGRSYRELGFWSDGIGFFDAIGETLINIGSIDISQPKKNCSMQDVFGQIFWPGGSLSTPRGWEIPTLATPLRIAVPNSTMINHFVKVANDPSSNVYFFSGFSIEVFKKTVDQLPYYLHYEFFAFDGTYDALVEQVRLKTFDAAVGDIGILSDRCKNADFTLPHADSGVVLVVPIRSQSNKAWLFLKPFTKAMWLFTVLMNAYNALVVWVIERKHCSELKGSALSQIGTFLWVSFASLFSLRGEGLHSDLSRMATAVWLIVGLIISQSYTASLTSMLTVPRLEPTASDIGALRDSNAVIGYSSKSFVKKYLLNVLHFNPKNIKKFSTIEETAEAFRAGKIAGAYLEIPTAKLMIAKFCKSFTIAGPAHKIGGYGYAFPKGSPLISDIDEALLKVFESGVLKELEDSLIASEKCVDIENDNNEILSLSPSSFSVLFAFSGGTSTAALVIYAIHSKCKIDTAVMTMLKHWRKQKTFSRKVSHSES